ncbi:MAG: hypothetical protein WCG98_09260 [bacterium]
MKKFFLFLAIVISLCSCKHDDPPKPKPFGDCPTNTTNVYWEAFIGLQDWQFLAYGHDGDIGIPTGGAVATNICTDCLWSIYDGHDGGYNDYYQVIPSDTAMRFTWKNNLLCCIELFPKWHGPTERGVRMGDGLDFFLTKYPPPYFNPMVDSTTYVSHQTGVDVVAEFTSKIPTIGKLKKLQLTRVP